MQRVFGNVIDQFKLKKELTLVFKELDDILIEHSGPFATNCIIGSKWRQVNDVDEMTKDGIKILRHLVVSEEAVARLAARMTRFIGIAVDKRCHDGTTTSMLLFCRLAICAIEKLDVDFLSNERYNWVKNIDDALGMCMEEIERLKITEDDIYQRCQTFDIDTSLEDVRASIAYHMAMISSKGDHDLATKIAYVIRSCPKKIFGMFTDIPLAVETEERYILKKQENDLSISCNIGNVQDYNFKNNTQYLSENAVIFATGNEIVTGSMESEYLRSFISMHPKIRVNLSEFGPVKGWEEYHEGKRNLILLTPMLNDPDLIAEINLFNKDNPNTRISYFNVQVQPRMRSSLNKTIHYMAGKKLFQDIAGENATGSLIGLDTKVTAHLIGHILVLNGLYEKEEGEVYHPFYRNPELFEPYTRFAQETEELLIFASEHITNPALDQDEVTYLTSLYRSLTCQEIYDIDIGGSAHDQYANRTVYEDAIGAALSAVNEGVILGGYAHLVRFFDGVGGTNSDNPILDKFFEAFLTLVEDSLRVPEVDMTVVDLIRSEAYDKWCYIFADPQKWRIASSSEDYIGMGSLDEKTLERFLMRDQNDIILLQAFGGYHEQFRRCRDILPKLANTSSLADMRIQADSDVR